MKYKKIKSIEQYNAYCKQHELFILQEDEVTYEDEIELLEILIEEYDNRVLKGSYEALNPVELLRTLLENANLSQTDLAKEIHVSRQLISDILAYRRNISKELVIKFANFFSMSQEAFSRAYTLKQTKNQEPINR